jgi:hypothetical protein
MPRSRLLRAASALIVLAPAPLFAQDKAKDQLERCERPIGTMALAEPREEYMQYLARFSPGSPTALLRLMVRSSSASSSSSSAPVWWS